MSTLRGLPVVVAVIAASTWVGGYYGLRIGTNGNLIEMASLDGPIRHTFHVTRLVQMRFMDRIAWDKALYEGGIPAMLEKLDPHSVFLDPKAFRKMRENERGSYAGVGMQIVSFGSKKIIDYPFPKTPAFEAGILPGDAIEQIDGQAVENLTLAEVAAQIKGRPGTTVSLSVSRDGLDRWLEVDLERNLIPQSTVPVRFLFEGGAGYLKLSSFGEKTGDELDEALAHLESQGMKGLLLDLRGNKGGLLSVGVRVASRFLNKGQSIVSHRGRVSKERHYRSQAETPVADYPVVVLVNCSSASASEIVAGALQDHDRALIAGTNTFGKGLVQSVFSLPEDTGVVLTTARYYSPSGRLIQRPYANITATEYFTEPCSQRYEPRQGAVRLTDQGRKVYELGGIAPDVPIEEPSQTAFQRRIERQRIVERFAARTRAKGRAMLRDESPSPEMLREFVEFIVSQGIPPDPLSDPPNRQFLIRALMARLHVSYFDYDEGQRILATYDPVVLQARSLLSDAAQLLRGSEETLPKARAADYGPDSAEAQRGS